MSHLKRSWDFCIKYFSGESNERYVNSRKGFAPYFISFESGPALEIMQRQDITEVYSRDHIGLTHLTFHMNKKEQADQMIGRFRMDGYTIAGETRVSGDGYYGGVIRDPDGNIVEIVANREPEIQVALFPPYELLLEADPDREEVEAYLEDSDCFIAAVRNSVADIVVIHKEEGRKAETMNLAMTDIFRQRRIARKLLRHTSSEWAPVRDVEPLRICIGTPAVGPMVLYQREDFDLAVVDCDYFVRNYVEPIWENGIQCRRQLILEKRLK